ncbi:MAG: toxin-antitoxin system YwqK family antitoxin [Bacteroidota bacterium]
MRNVLLLFSCLFLLACGQNGSNPAPVAGAADFSGYQLEPYSNGAAQRAVKKDENGNLVEEGTVINGQRSGTWITYHPDEASERVKTITTYTNGVKNGTFVELNDRGQVIVQCFFNNDQYDGVYSKFKFGSRKEKQISYKNGVLDGLYTEYHDNGKLRKEVPYRNGKIHGKLRNFNDQEELVLEYEYQNGEKVSGGIVTQ